MLTEVTLEVLCERHDNTVYVDHHWLCWSATSEVTDAHGVPLRAGGFAVWGAQTPLDIEKLVYIEEVAAATPFAAIADGSRMLTSHFSVEVLGAVVRQMLPRRPAMAAALERFGVIVAPGLAGRILTATTMVIHGGTTNKRFFDDGRQAYSWVMGNPGHTLHRAVTRLIDDVQARHGLVLATRDALRASPGLVDEALARHLGLPLRSLRRELAAEGTTLERERARARMVLAAEILLTRDEKVESVADLVGYRSFSHFSKAFVSFHGLAPAAYRKHLRPG